MRRTRFIRDMSMIVPPGALRQRVMELPKPVGRTGRGKCFELRNTAEISLGEVGWTVTAGAVFAECASLRFLAAIGSFAPSVDCCPGRDAHAASCSFRNDGRERWQPRCRRTCVP